ncbi:metallophosphoesterase family protein [Longispora albida]|uniref:metallophosphoesterase family protein n=1 Tax=Longispora albida TaxID=203523 RepID=UPI000365190E|nr:metallophosphoesterase [Longispora albida]
MIKAVGLSDWHRGRTDYPASFADLIRRGEDNGADLWVLPGDLSQGGTPKQMRQVAADLSVTSLPKLAVWGNHDTYQRTRAEIAENAAILADAGVTLLDYSGAVVTVRGITVAVAGGIGFGGGWSSTVDAENAAGAMRVAAWLAGCGAQVKLLMWHYAPAIGITIGEKAAPWKLGSWLLGEVADIAGADHVFCGHVHWGSPRAATPGGITVDNCAWALRQDYTDVQVPVRALAAA